MLAQFGVVFYTQLMTEIWLLWTVQIAIEMCANKSIISFAILKRQMNAHLQMRKLSSSSSFRFVSSRFHRVSTIHSCFIHFFIVFWIGSFSSFEIIVVFCSSLHLFEMWSIKWHVAVQYAKDNALCGYLYWKKTHLKNRIKCANEERAKRINWHRNSRGSLGGLDWLWIDQ